MAETRWLALPLLEAGQAQKHVTVNEALTRLDALTAPAAISRSVAAPPEAAVEGDAHIVPAGASGAWAGRDGALAFFDNGGWSFAAPAPGRRVWVIDEGREVVFDGAAWVAGLIAGREGATSAARVIDLDHEVTPGAVSVTIPIIPDKAVVFGVTGRVVSTLTGPDLSGWRLGAGGDPARYGSGYGVERNAFAQGVTGTPIAYFGETPLTLSAEGGAFEGGVVRLAVHCLELTPPRPV